MARHLVGVVLHLAVAVHRLADVHVHADPDRPVLLKATVGMTRPAELSQLAARTAHARSRAAINRDHNDHTHRAITRLDHGTATRIDGMHVMLRKLVARSR